jgi:hypothetical protein
MPGAAAALSVPPTMKAVYCEAARTRPKNATARLLRLLKAELLFKQRRQGSCSLRHG